MFSRQGTLPIAATAGSPSLQLNNLSSANGCVVFVRFSEVIIVNSSGEATKLPGQKSQVHQATFTNHNGVNNLIVTSNIGVQVWSENGEDLLFFYALNTLPYEEGVTCTGLSASQNILSVGTSTGDILVFNIPASKSNDMILLHKLESGPSPITATASTGQFMAAGNEEGDIFLYNCEDTFTLQHRFAGAGHCCTSLVMRGDVLVAAYSSGHIRVFRVNISELAVEIAAHSRNINGLALSPRDDIFISCSEDQFVNVWTFPTFRSRESSAVDLVSSTRLDNKLCTGAAFLTPDRFAIAAYDDADIFAFVRS